MGRAPTVYVTHKGQQLTLPQLAKATGLTLPSLRWRWQAGARGEDLIKPARVWVGTVARKAMVETSEAEALTERQRRAPCIARQVREWNTRVFGITATSGQL